MTVRCGRCAGPIFHSCPRGTRIVQRLGYSIGYSHRALALILDRLLFRPDTSQAGSDRAGAGRGRWSPPSATGCCCCCHCCCQLSPDRLRLDYALRACTRCVAYRSNVRASFTFSDLHGTATVWPRRAGAAPPARPVVNLSSGLHWIGWGSTLRCTCWRRCWVRWSGAPSH
jgi:hypothetical protein